MGRRIKSVIVILGVAVALAVVVSDAAYPERWIGLVEVETVDGERITPRVEVPKGDPVPAG